MFETSDSSAHPDDRSAQNLGASSRADTHHSVLLLNQLTGRQGPAPGVPRERRKDMDRRRHSAWSFLYGGLRPRRRFGRRLGDEHRIFLDWHEPRVLYIALAIVLMSCADALFTLNLLAVGGQEVNAFMRAMLGHGVRWFLWVKIGLTGMSIVILVAVARRRVLGVVPVWWLIRLVFAGYVALIGWEIYLLGWQVQGLRTDLAEEFSRWLSG
jgi:hypothetical protein